VSKRVKLGPWPCWPLDRGDGVPDAAALLWTDRDTCRAPAANAGRVVTSIVSVLDQERPLGGAEEDFLDVYAAVVARGRERLASVWSDPRAYAWARYAHGLVIACLEGIEPSGSLVAYCDAIGAADPRAALLRHLTLFKSLVLGIESDRHCAMVRRSGYHWRLHPEALALPGWPLAAPGVLGDREYHERHMPLVEGTLENIERYAPDAFEHFARSIKVFALKPRSSGGYDDFSNPELPGSFIASVVENPLEMGDHFIHELQHNRLSFLEESGPLFDDTPDPGRYYSPWRENARSLYGVFHGVYVFAGLYHYWRKVLASDAIDQAARAYALDRVVRLPLQLTLAVRMLERYAHLAPLGRLLLDQLRRDVEQIHDDLLRANLPVDAPAIFVRDDGTYAPQLSRGDQRSLTVRAAVQEHAMLHDAFGQCAGLGDR
jgi:hypothetical protein